MKIKFRVYDDISKCMKNVSFDEIRNCWYCISVIYFCTHNLIFYKFTINFE